MNEDLYEEIADLKSEVDRLRSQLNCAHIAVNTNSKFIKAERYDKEQLQKILKKLLEYPSSAPEDLIQEARKYLLDL
jgi:cell division septum initiation protein DivIVA